MTHDPPNPLTTKDAIERLVMLMAKIRAGGFENPQDLDATDLDRLKEVRAQIDNTLNEQAALDIFRQQPWGERIKPQYDVDMTVQQLASDVARLEDAQKQNPALLRGSLDSLHDSMQRIDSLLEQHVGHFATAERLSRGAGSRERQ
jgi:hypothetical protein